MLSWWQESYRFVQQMFSLLISTYRMSQLSFKGGYWLWQILQSTLEEWMRSCKIAAFSSDSVTNVDRARVSVAILFVSVLHEEVSATSTLLIVVRSHFQSINDHHWTAVVSSDWVKASTCRVQVSLSCAFLGQIVSLHRSVGLLLSYGFDLCLLSDPDVGPSALVCDVENNTFHFGLCGHKFAICMFGEFPGLLQMS